MTEPFIPADGKRARWRYVYDLVASKKPGDEITYLELEELLGVDASTAQSVMHEAKRHLETAKLHTVRTVPRFGWIVIDAKGNLAEIEHRRKRAGRAVERTARLIAATDRDALDAAEKRQLDFNSSMILSARNVYRRRSPSFAELEEASKERAEVPVRRQLRRKT